MKIRTLTLTLYAALALFITALPSVADDGDFASSFSAQPYGLGQQFDLSQYQLKTVDGEDAGNLGDYSGKYVYVDLWATW